MPAINFTSLLRGKYLRVLTVALAAQAVLFYSASHGESTPLALPLSAFPYSFGDWHMLQEGVIEKETVDALRADDLLNRFYASPEGGANLFIAYFKTQRTGQSPHSPKNCLPGSGWQPVSSESGRMNVSAGGDTIRVNRYVVSKGGEESVVFYWYQSQGRVIADEFAARFYLIADSIRKHRSDTSLVRVVVPVEGQQRARAEKVALDFVQAAYPVVKAYLPR
ncbi:MAG TPA: EpsI family protein [Bryobacteraceae bacterium]|jgi:EpsI family protein|nr:EpsI family protein [Bryobacteraceae bacterium]